MSTNGLADVTEATTSTIRMETSINDVAIVRTKSPSPDSWPNISVNVSPKLKSSQSSKPSSSQICAKCQRLISGQYVRALGATHHMDCFRCKDCNTVVASKFFPVDGPDGIPFPLCERDYFKRLDLICNKCSGALRGSYITALEKKYHIEHFTCSICPTIFGQNDSYYEHQGNVYCHFHYSTKFAVKCSGCLTAILKQFVEINRNNVEEHWHPECYMIHKFWNVKIVSGDQPEDSKDKDNSDADTLRRNQRAMEDKVYRIWTILSAFEESSAASISEMLLHVSNGAYIDGVAMAEKFIVHVEVLFCAIDDLEARLQTRNQGLSFNRESKMLCKKIVNFFSLLSQTQESDTQRLGITQELLSLVTGLAHYLKMLIRIALTGSLRLERSFGDNTAINDFLGKLVDLAKDKQPLKARSAIKSEMSSDLCHRCCLTIEEECVSCQGYRWHMKCFCCGKCGREFSNEHQDARFQRNKEIIICRQCCEEPSQCLEEFVLVTKLEQYAFLLRVALVRLYNLLRLKNSTSPGASMSLRDPSTSSFRGDVSDPSNSIQLLSPKPPLPISPVVLQGDMTSTNSYPSNPISDNRSGARPADSQPEKSSDQEVHTSYFALDVKRMKSIHLDRKLSNSARIPKRSTIVETPTAENALQDSNMTKTIQRLTIVDETPPETDPNDITFDDAEVITLADIPSVIALQGNSNQRERRGGGGISTFSPDHLHAHPTHGQRKTSHTMRGKKWLSELSALEYFIVKHVAVLLMEAPLKPYFTLEELLDLIETRKNTFWGKFAGAFKSGADKKPPIKKKGTFGVPLEVLIERNGVDSLWGAGPVRIRIPTFIDETISAMRQMDMSVEGIFRKNGNIRRLKELTESIDKNLSSVNLNDDSPVQLAALLKKFLREMPDPLLTFKLHKLWVTSQNIEDEGECRRILHLICCLLPRCHRDSMEALFCFLRWVASFSHVDEESGSKMDLNNLATVVCPNILYSKSKDPTKDESFAAINAVHMLLLYADDFAMVPDDLQAVLQDPEMFSLGPDELTTKDILRRAETFVRSRKNQVNETVVSNIEATQPIRPRVTLNQNESQGIHGSYQYLNN